MNFIFFLNLTIATHIGTVSLLLCPEIKNVKYYGFKITGIKRGFFKKTERP